MQCRSFSVGLPAQLFYVSGMSSLTSHVQQSCTRISSDSSTKWNTVLTNPRIWYRKKTGAKLHAPVFWYQMLKPVSWALDVEIILPILCPSCYNNIDWQPNVNLSSYSSVGFNQTDIQLEKKWATSVRLPEYLASIALNWEVRFINNSISSSFVQAASTCQQNKWQKNISNASKF